MKILPTAPTEINYRPGPDSPNPVSPQERERRARVLRIGRKAWEDAGKIAPVEEWERELVAAKGGEDHA